MVSDVCLYEKMQTFQVWYDDDLAVDSRWGQRQATCHNQILNAFWWRPITNVVVSVIVFDHTIPALIAFPEDVATKTPLSLLAHRWSKPFLQQQRTQQPLIYPFSVAFYRSTYLQAIRH